MPSWIYQIIDKESNEIIYIGSTTGKYFCLRKGEHTRPSTTKSNRQPKLYNYVQEKGGWDKFMFDIILKIDTIDKIDLRLSEKKYIQERNPKCNSFNPIETEEEHKERKRLQSKKWRTLHPEYNEISKNRESQKRYIEKRCSTKIECECGGKYTLQNKTNHFSRNIHKEYENKKIKTEINKEVTPSE